MPRTITPRQLRNGVYKGAGIVPQAAPLSSVNLEDDESIVDWLNIFLTEFENIHNQFVYEQEMRRQLYSYGNIYTTSDGRQRFYTDVGNRDSRPMSHFAINRVYNGVETWVSKITKFQSNVTVNPAAPEYSDQQGAKLGKLVADHISYLNDSNMLSQECVRLAYVDGETFVKVWYDQNFGDDFSSGQSSPQQGVVDSEGNPVQSEDDKQLMIQPSSKQGDVRLEKREARYIILEPALKYQDVNYYVEIIVDYVDNLRSEYPDADIQANNSGPVDWPWLNLSEQETIVYRIVHRGTTFLGEGCEILVCGDEVLEKGPYKLKARRDLLDIIRLTDKELPGVLRATSRIDNVAVSQIVYNNLWSIAYTNTSLAGHAYWLLPTSGNVKTEAIRNGTAIIKYTGTMKPELATFRTVGPEIFTMLSALEKVIDDGMGHQGISQGDPPPGIDAALALGVLEEQENQRANPEIKRYNSFIKNLYTVALACAQDNYSKTDGRYIRIVGKGNMDTIKAIDTTRFSGPFDVRVERSTSLSESKSLRLQQLILLRQQAPEKFSEERFLDMMEFSDEKEFFDIGTAATKAAEAENELFVNGEPVLEPTPVENSIAHLDVHYPFMQSLRFKEDLPDEVKAQFYAHVNLHEYDLYMQCWVNLALCQKVIAMDQFPRVFTPDIPVAQIPQMVAQGLTYQMARAQRQQMQNMMGVAPLAGGDAGMGGGLPTPVGGDMAGEPSPQEESMTTMEDTVPGRQRAMSGEESGDGRPVSQVQTDELGDAQIGSRQLNTDRVRNNGNTGTDSIQ